MIAFGSDEFTTLICQAASLRGQRKFEEAMTLVEGILGKLKPDCLANAYLEVIYAAQEGGFPETATKYATLLAQIDPEIPTVKTVMNNEVDP